MIGRIGEPEDIANAVVFLASPESGWITAQVLTVDVDGWTILDTVRSSAAQVPHMRVRHPAGCNARRVT